MTDATENLKTLNDLHSAGVLSDREFAEARARLLSRTPDSKDGSEFSSQYAAAIGELRTGRGSVVDLERRSQAAGATGPEIVARLVEASITTLKSAGVPPNAEAHPQFQKSFWTGGSYTARSTGRRLWVIPSPSTGAPAWNWWYLTEQGQIGYAIYLDPQAKYLTLRIEWPEIVRRRIGWVFTDSNDDKGSCPRLRISSELRHAAGAGGPVFTSPPFTYRYVSQEWIRHHSGNPPVGGVLIPDIARGISRISSDFLGIGIDERGTAHNLDYDGGTRMAYELTGWLAKGVASRIDGWEQSLAGR